MTVHNQQQAAATVIKARLSRSQTPLTVGRVNKLRSSPANSRNQSFRSDFTGCTASR